MTTSKGKYETHRDGKYCVAGLRLNIGLRPKLKRTEDMKSYKKALQIFTIVAAGQMSAFPMQSATGEGKFSVRGIGAASCSILVADLKGDQGKAVRLRLSDWVAGWLSQANRSTPNSFDLFPIQDPFETAHLVALLCQKNPDTLVETVLASVVTALVDSSDTGESEILNLKNGEQQVNLRSSVLMRLQKKLVEQSLLEENMADGTFGPASQKAFEDYQAAHKMKVTGLPDVPTLYMLLKAN
jgi:hypothetical protein